MDLLGLPNEIICDIYQYLNPNDQLRFAKVSKIFRECLPDWKRDHQKSFIKCINQINEIKYNIINWGMCHHKANDFPITYKYEHGAFDIINRGCVTSQLLFRGVVTYYCIFSYSYYYESCISFTDTLYSFKGHADNYDADKVIWNDFDLRGDKNLIMNTYQYRTLIIN